jgi:glycosyltransferase involved in cell wall biosynthesis
MLSIIVPALNEEKTIEIVLRKLRHANWHSAELVTEIIVADGGSADNTADIVSRMEDIRLVRAQTESGLGAAILAGLAVCKGNILLFFPADDEYAPEDLLRVVRPILTEDAKVVFGSRSMKCVNLDNVLRKIYGNKKFLYLLSKYGGLSISAAILWRYGQFISDPLTSVKAFQYDFFRSLALKEQNHAVIGEMIAKTALRGEYILEVPVSYNPRHAKQGKKMNISAGLKVLSRVIRRWR